MKRLSLLLFFFAMSNSTLADALAPFDAEFRIYVNRLPTPVKAHLVLEPLGDDAYHMRLKAKSFLLTNTEESFFHWRNCQPRTSRYVHEFDGFGQERFHHMQFMWAPPQVENVSEEETRTFTIADDTLDELTMLLRGQCVFAAGERAYTVTTAYGKRIRTHRFEIIDEETIDTPMGEIDTLVVEKKREGDKKKKRRTLFWVAPSLDYMVVKARHIESSFLKADMVMIDYQNHAPEAPAPVSDTESETLSQPAEEEPSTTPEAA